MEVMWRGGSGRQYEYFVYGISPNFDPKQDGNYIFAREDGVGGWAPVYIGQGDLKERTENHHKAYCITAKGATHVHAHLNAEEKSRLAEEQDLLAGHPEAHAPTGCNEKEGG